MKKILQYAIRYPGSSIVVVGREHWKLRTQVMLPMMNMLPKMAYREDYKHNEICICNGSRIRFRTVRRVENTWLMSGMEAEAVFCDEDVCDVPEWSEIFFILKTHLRSAKPFPLRFYIGAEEVKLSAGGGDSDSAAKPEAAPVPEE